MKKINSRWLLILAVVSLFFTAFVVQHSFERGRLQHEVDYEDDFPRWAVISAHAKLDAN